MLQKRCKRLFNNYLKINEPDFNKNQTKHIGILAKGYFNREY